MSWLGYLIFIPTTMILFLRFLALILPTRAANLVSFTAFSITAVLTMAACASYGVIASIVLRCIGYGGLSQWTVARAFKWSMWLLTGVTFDVQGSMKRGEGGLNGEDGLATRPAVFVGNHQTELDVLMLGCVFPKYTSVTAKSSLKWVPFLGWFMALSKTVFINRSNHTSARAAFTTAVTTMQTTKQSVFIFPEGTRSYASTPTLLPFKKGAFHLAVQAQVPIVPVVVANYSHVLNIKAKKFSPGSVPVTVLPPIQTKGLGAQDVDMLVEKTRAAMLEELIRLSHVVSQDKGEPLPRASALEGREGVRKRA